MQGTWSGDGFIRLAVTDRNVIPHGSVGGWQGKQNGKQNGKQVLKHLLVSKKILLVSKTDLLTSKIGREVRA